MNTAVKIGKKMPITQAVEPVGGLGYEAECENCGYPFELYDNDDSITMVVVHDDRVYCSHRCAAEHTAMIAEFRKERA